MYGASASRPVQGREVVPWERRSAPRYRSKEAEFMAEHPIQNLMNVTMDKIRQMVDSNTIVGEPITTPDGVTLIPVSRLSYGFGCGGGDYGKNKENSGAGCGAGVRVEPMAFLVVKGGVTRMLPVGTPAITTVDRVIEMVPELLDRVEGFVDKKRNKDF